MSSNERGARNPHAVILTAIPLEYQAVRQVKAGTWEGSQWEEEEGPNGLPVAFRTFRGKGGRPLRVAVAQSPKMGATAATNTLLSLVQKYGPRCVAMSGVCAGHPKKTNLGDVIAAERLFFHDTGKKLPEEFQHDLETYNLREDWKVALENFPFKERFREEPWWGSRPVPYEWQENWVLAKLHEGIEDPASLPECAVWCQQWETVIDSLWKEGHLEEGTLRLTDKGRKRIGAILIRHRNRLPDPSPSETLIPFKVQVAPMGSGSPVVEDEKIWTTTAAYMRKTLGVEMEAAALGALAQAQRDYKLDALVMKGVMDFANAGRDDHFKEFAARASAECLIAFLREQLDVEVEPDIDDLLVPGFGTLPENPPPSALLNARYEVVPFHERGREELLSELDRWCDEGTSIAVWLIHAEGGAGKTRLAIEWTRRRQARGWAAGFLAKEVPGDWFKRLCGLSQPVLVVIDYAESRSDLREALMRILRYAQQEGTGRLQRIRILLLARNDGDWWQSLRQHDTALGAWLDVTPPRLLPPLVQETTEREQVFHEAAERFANKQGKEYVKRAPLPLTDHHFERVLYLHMAALASVEGLVFEVNTLMEVILDHEERFWEVRAQQGDVTRSLQRSLARQMVAAATLRGGFADASSASTVAGLLLRRTPSSDEQALLLLLQRIYQRTGTIPDVFLPALEPDLLGEGMVCRVASPKLKGERVPDDWINRVFPAKEEQRVIRTGLEVLGRASATQPLVVRPWIERLLTQPFQQRARLALEAAKAIGLRTAFSVLGDILADRLEVDGDATLVHELEAVGIPDSTVSLRRVAEWASRRLLGALPASEDSRVLAEKAQLLSKWSTQLSKLGRREEALQAMREAVELYRKLATHNPDDFRLNLAGYLNNLGNRLSELGRREEALQATREAVEAYQTLAQSNPNVPQPNLALSLSNLSTMLSEQGRHEEALQTMREVVEAFQTLAKNNADAFLPYFVASLNNLGARLSELGRHEEALQTTRDAVDAYQALAQSNPDAFQPDLAGSLNNLGAMLGKLGRYEEALQAMRDAIGVYQALATRHPDAFRPYLAASLKNLGTILSELGRHEEALQTTRDAVEIYQALAMRHPDAFRAYLALSLNHLGNRLIELGQSEKALQTMRQVVKSYQSLSQSNPDTFLAYLTLNIKLGNRLIELSRSEEALQAMCEAVEIYQAMETHPPKAFQSYLALSLNNLSNRFDELDQREEALQATREAVKLWREVATRNPDDFRSELAGSLHNLGVRMSELERHEEALQAMRETVEVWRELAKSNPDDFRPYLAMSLNNLGNGLSELGRHEEALEATREAVDAYQVLAHNNPDAFQPDLAMSLNNLGAMLSKLGQREEALQATHEAVELRRELATRHPDDFRPYLAGSLKNLSNRLRELGRHEEALQAMREAIENIWPFFERLPPAFARKTAAILQQLQTLYKDLQRPLPPELQERLATFARLTST